MPELPPLQVVATRDDNDWAYPGDFQQMLRRALGQTWDVHMQRPLDDFNCEIQIHFHRGDFQADSRVNRYLFRDRGALNSALYETVENLLRAYERWLVNRILNFLAPRFAPISRAEIEQREIFLGRSGIPPLQIRWNT